MREVLLIVDDLKCRKTGAAARVVKGADERRLAYCCEECGFEGNLEAHFDWVAAAGARLPRSLSEAA
jgi:hypothetical protein